MKQRIAFDMDEVMADLISELLERYNERFEDTLTVQDLKAQKLRAVRPHHTKEIYEILQEPGFFASLDVMPDAVEVMKELHDHYEIFIATAAMEVPTSFSEKFYWLREHFPFLNPQNFVFCGDKSIIHADYLVDDHPDKLESFSGESIMYTAFHNVNDSRFKRVDNWQELRAFFLPATVKS
ncbi:MULTISPECIES: 5'-3'-deoxyribonucleotidase [unclassified Geomicrobium]|uniref:5' nucleotidase, NT5C type n=1 Tax=unclassified Geomicrobium TaxID=2628951 RepID=UPI00045EDD60|nr:MULTISPECIES: 5'-3'-deoxyribonucleotidase [unclassified Geomicrobium]GAJ99465.1 5'(3')-deoxyribonucleotidase [Geomicrobium sp. JCM 19055]GAK08741.1 5'(3')-deoxyribonucleotidase [Geomicrobium sp. JCM 19038]